MSHLVTTIIVCCISSYVFGNYIVELKDRFVKIDNQIRELGKANDEISEKIFQAEDEFKRRLRHEGRKEKSLNNDIQTAVKVLKELQLNLTKQSFLEKKLGREIQIEKFHTKRYQLAITLLKQDISLLNSRRQEQLNTKCFKLDEQVAPEILLRTLTGDDSELIVLQSILQRKLTALTHAQSLNKQLTEEYKDKQEEYAKVLQDVLNKVEANTVDLRMIEGNGAEIQNRLTDKIKKVASMNDRLLQLQKENSRLGSDIKDQKAQLQEFSNDSECYKKLYSEDFLHIVAE